MLLVHRLRIPHINPRARNLPRLQRLVERLLVHHPAAAGRDQIRRRLHQRQLRRPHQTPRLRAQRRMHRHIIRPHHLLQRGQPHPRRLRDRRIHIRVVGDHIQPERLRPNRRLLRNVPERHQPQRLPVERARRPQRHPRPRPRRVVVRHQLPVQRQQQRHRMRRHLINAVVRDVADHNPVLRRRLPVDVVEPNPVPHHHLEPGRRLEDRPPHLPVPADDPVRVAHMRRNILLLLQRQRNQLRIGLGQLLSLRRMRLPLRPRVDVIHLELRHTQSLLPNATLRRR